MSAEDLKTLVKEAANLAVSDLIFRGEFINFTPWWGGNFKGDTLLIDENNIALATIPDVKTITGKTTWFMRTVFGDNFLKNLGIIEGSMDKAKSKLTVIVSAPRIAIDLRTGFMYSCSDNREGSCRALYLALRDSDALMKMLDQVKKIVHNIDKNRSRRDELKQELKLKKRAIENLCKMKTDDIISNAVSKEEDISQDLKDFLSIYCVTRVRLRVREDLTNWYIGNGSPNGLEDIIAKLPLKPGSVKFTIEVRSQREYKSLSKQFVEALIFTLYYLGIGSAANRGFGRFKLIKENVSLAEDVINIKDIDSEAIRNKLSKINTVDVRKDSFPLFRGVKELGIIRGGIEEALKCIGEATLKVQWKIINGANRRDSGFKYHTWVLGLPRQGKTDFSGDLPKTLKIPEFNKNFIIYEDENKKEIITGYAFFARESKEDIELSDAGKDKDTLVQRRQSYLVFSVVEEGSDVKILSMKFIPNNKLADTQIISKAFHIGVHRNAKIISNEITSELQAKNLEKHIDNAMSQINKYLQKKCSLTIPSKKIQTSEESNDTIKR
jgi:hypothetical protein